MPSTATIWAVTMLSIELTDIGLCVAIFDDMAVNISAERMFITAFMSRKPVGKAPQNLTLIIGNPLFVKTFPIANVSTFSIHSFAHSTFVYLWYHVYRHQQSYYFCLTIFATVLLFLPYYFIPYYFWKLVGKQDSAVCWWCSVAALSLSRDLDRINNWRDSWSIRLNSCRRKSVLISTSHTVNSVHPLVITGNEAL